MELKHTVPERVQDKAALLIVPYGIETCKQLQTKRDRYLLIVPYGIETTSGKGQTVKSTLLIVPYGIETLYGLSEGSETLTFNRTLWN